MEAVAVIDFETTGLSPEYGARATEIAVVLVRKGRIVDRYHSLMNAGLPVPPFIEELTGITTEMVRSAPSAARVMREAADFLGDLPLAAHNASFDRKFLDAELRRIGRARRRDLACSMLLGRRIYPNAPNHKLDTLARHLGVPATGRHHRALADAETAAHLVLRISEQLTCRFGVETVPHDLLLSIQRSPRHGLEACVERFLRGR